MINLYLKILTLCSFVQGELDDVTSDAEESMGMSSHSNTESGMGEDDGIFSLTG